MTNECKVIYLDEQLPPVNVEVPLVIVEVPHFESTDSELEIHDDDPDSDQSGSF